MFSNRRPLAYTSALYLVFFLLLLTACSTSQPSATSQATRATSPTSPTDASKATPSTSPTSLVTIAPSQRSCQHSSPLDESKVGTEVQGSATHATLWGLIESTTGIPPQAKTDVKIVWRMTGSGDFTIVASGPQNKQVRPSQGPAAHAGSNWPRPGDEWGTVFTFPLAGCWNLHATRGNASGNVWLDIVN